MGTLRAEHCKAQGTGRQQQWGLAGTQCSFLTGASGQDLQQTASGTSSLDTVKTTAQRCAFLQAWTRRDIPRSGTPSAHPVPIPCSRAAHPRIFPGCTGATSRCQPSLGTPGKALRQLQKTLYANPPTHKALLCDSEFLSPPCGRGGCQAGPGEGCCSQPRASPPQKEPRGRRGFLGTGPGCRAGCPHTLCWAVSGFCSCCWEEFQSPEKEEAAAPAQTSAPWVLLREG